MVVYSGEMTRRDFERLRESFINEFGFTKMFRKNYNLKVDQGKIIVKTYTYKGISNALSITRTNPKKEGKGLYYVLLNFSLPLKPDRDGDLLNKLEYYRFQSQNASKKNESLRKPVAQPK